MVCVAINYHETAAFFLEAHRPCSGSSRRSGCGAVRAGLGRQGRTKILNLVPVASPRGLRPLETLSF